jgi:hypothetical protein
VCAFLSPPVERRAYERKIAALRLIQMPRGILLLPQDAQNENEIRLYLVKDDVAFVNEAARQNIDVIPLLSYFRVFLDQSKGPFQAEEIFFGLRFSERFEAIRKKLMEIVFGSRR